MKKQSILLIKYKIIKEIELAKLILIIKTKINKLHN